MSTKKVSAKRGRKAKLTTSSSAATDSQKSELKVYSSGKTSTTKKKQTKHQSQEPDNLEVIILRLKIDLKNTKGNIKGPLPYSALGYEYEHFTENMDKSPPEADDNFYKQNTITDQMVSTSINIANELDMVENTAMSSVVDSMLEYTEAKKHKKWPKHVNIACYWCSEFFETIPVGVPVRVEIKKTGSGKKQTTNNIYYCEDNYCTFECAVADLFKQKKGNYRERYSLLCFLYKEAHKLPKVKKIKSALPKKALERYGGPHSVDKFRELSKIDEVVYSVVDPPMIPVLSQLESNYMEFSVANKANSYIPINRQLASNTAAHPMMNAPNMKYASSGIHTDNTLQRFMKES